MDGAFLDHALGTSSSTSDSSSSSSSSGSEDTTDEEEEEDDQTADTQANAARAQRTGTSSVIHSQQVVQVLRSTDGGYQEVTSRMTTEQAFPFTMRAADERHKSKGGGRSQPKQRSLAKGAYGGMLRPGEKKKLKREQKEAKRAARGARRGFDVQAAAAQITDFMAGEGDMLVLDAHGTHAQDVVIRLMRLAGLKASLQGSGKHQVAVATWHADAIPGPRSKAVAAKVRAAVDAELAAQRKGAAAGGGVGPAGASLITPLVAARGTAGRSQAVGSLPEQQQQAATGTHVGPRQKQRSSAAGGTPAFSYGRPASSPAMSKYQVPIQFVRGTTLVDNSSADAIIIYPPRLPPSQPHAHATPTTQAAELPPPPPPPPPPRLDDQGEDAVAGTDASPSVSELVQAPQQHSQQQQQDGPQAPQAAVAGLQQRQELAMEDALQPGAVGAQGQGHTALAQASTAGAGGAAWLPVLEFPALQGGGTADMSADQSILDQQGVNNSWSRDAGGQSQHQQQQQQQQQQQGIALLWEQMERRFAAAAAAQQPQRHHGSSHNHNHHSQQQQRQQQEEGREPQQFVPAAGPAHDGADPASHLHTPHTSHDDGGGAPASRQQAGEPVEAQQAPAAVTPAASEACSGEGLGAVEAEHAGLPQQQVGPHHVSHKAATEEDEQQEEAEDEHEKAEGEEGELEQCVRDADEEGGAEGEVDEAEEGEEEGEEEPHVGLGYHTIVDSGEHVYTRLNVGLGLGLGAAQTSPTPQPARSLLHGHTDVLSALRAANLVGPSKHEQQQAGGSNGSGSGSSSPSDASPGHSPGLRNGSKQGGGGGKGRRGSTPGREGRKAVRAYVMESVLGSMGLGVEDTGDDIMATSPEFTVNRTKQQAKAASKKAAKQARRAAAEAAAAGGADAAGDGGDGDGAGPSTLRARAGVGAAAPTYALHLTFGGFEQHTTGIGSSLMRRWGWAEGSGLGRAQQGRPVPVMAAQRPKNLGLGALPE